MTTFFILTVVGALAAPAAAEDAVIRDAIRHEVTGEAWRDQTREQQERERERIERERQRAREQADRDEQRAREQAERDRQRAQQQAERDRERARDRAQRGEGIEEIERTTRTLRIGNNGELHLANVVGDITITRGGGNDAVVEIVKTARGRSTEEAKELLGLVTIDVVERGMRAEVRTRYPQGEEMRRNRRNVNVWVAFNVTVPAATRVRANSVAGAVSAADLKGDVTLKSVSGNVRIHKGGGLTEAESISGNVEVRDADLASLAASSASGSVLVQRVKARQLELTSISGGVVLDDVESPRVEAQSVSGDVKVGGVLPKNSRWELNSHSGSVMVAIAGSGFEVEATSFSGSIRSDFNFSGSGTERVGRGPGRTLRGIHGDGSAVLEITSFSGNIVISKR